MTVRGFEHVAFVGILWCLAAEGGGAGETDGGGRAGQGPTAALLRTDRRRTDLENGAR